MPDQHSDAGTESIGNNIKGIGGGPKEVLKTRRDQLKTHGPEDPMKDDFESGGYAIVWPYSQQSVDKKNGRQEQWDTKDIVEVVVEKTCPAELRGLDEPPVGGIEHGRGDAHPIQAIQKSAVREPSSSSLRVSGYCESASCEA